ncbi:MAG: hypothetical protein Q7S76_03340 [bacterium]|nr:hypothetical protein [bacterium]
MMHTQNPSFFQKKLKRFRRKITISKRQKLVLITLGLTLGLLLTQLVSVELRYPGVFILSILTAVLTAVGLREDLRGIEWLTLLTLPTLFTTGVSLFYFLLPVRWLTRLPAAGLYAVGIYALLLTENIYNVAANRTIALLRAAHSVGFLLTLVSYFLIVQTILAFRLAVIFDVLLVGVLSFLLAFQALWSVELEEKVSERTLRISLSLMFMCMQLAWVFSFWPVNRTLVALFMTTFFYSGVGVSQQYLVQKLYKKTALEFFSVTFIVFLIVIIATRWRGSL